MSTVLDYTGDALTIKIGRMESEDFSHTLNVVKSIPGRRYSGETKLWSFPPDYMTAQKIMNMLAPVPSARANAWLRQARTEAADAVRTHLPDDAELHIAIADKLYPYQRADVAFMAEHQRVIDANDMGLGKTIEAIATVAEVGANGPFLVVCPNAMVETWVEEIAKWAPGPPQAKAITGKTPLARRQQISRWPGSWTVVNWEKLRIMPELAAVSWGAVIADEAHRAKNRKAKQTRALWKLDAPLKLALTGTPIMNSPDELWSVLKWLYPKTYTSYWRFYEEYCEYVELNFGPRRGRLITGVKNVDKLRFELADKLVRRTKKEALPDLPDKLPPQIILVPMKPKQRRLYDEVEEQLWVKVAQAAAAGEPAALAAVEHHSLLLLPNAAARTVRLRQVASTPALLGAADDSAKLDGIVEYIADMDPEAKAIVFTEFTGTADILAERLDRRKISAAAYHGKVAAGTRNELKHEFQEQPDPRVLVCTPETGGVGLTLTRANVAILCEEDWTPTNDDQAVDRLHRIGQDKEVHVLVFRCADSVETERVAPTAIRKRRIIGAVIKQD
jgi:SNF2 family DNA or RNA helicase